MTPTEPAEPLTPEELAQDALAALNPPKER
jgi:hypothetical protein